VRGAHQEVQVEGPVLAVLEGAKPVQHEGFAGSVSWTQSFMEEKTVSAEAFAETLDRTFGNVHLTGDLSEPGAGDQTVEEGLEELWSAEPVVG
jgi:hypothetical protein